MFCVYSLRAFVLIAHAVLSARERASLKNTNPHRTRRNMNWFYESAGQQQGPISEQEFDRLIAEGKITAETLVWREGLADWQPLRIARPAIPAEPPAMPSGEVPPGHVRCSLTGKIIP